MLNNAVRYVKFLYKFCFPLGISLVDETKAPSGDALPQASGTQELVKGLEFAYDVPSQDATDGQDVSANTSLTQCNSPNGLVCYEFFLM